MSKSTLTTFLAVCIALTACTTSTPIPIADTLTLIAPSPIPLPLDTATLPPAETATPLPTDAPPATAAPVTPVASIDATVTVDLLSCRYGPGSEYLFLYGLRKGANIKLIGQTGGNNWVWVDGKNKCWVNLKFIEIAGDYKTLPVVYPGIAKLPVSPYYPPTTVLSASRNGTTVEVHWLEVPVNAGDYKDETMQIYIIEVWRCEAGQMIFDPLATNDTSITFADEPGCAVPSHGRVFVQEKHGFAGPAEIPWP